MAHKRDTTWTDKDQCLNYWIEASGQPDIDLLQRLLPRRKLSTLRLWVSAFNRGDRSVGYPRSARKRVPEILAVLKKNGASSVAIESAKIIEDEMIPLQGDY